MNHYSRGKVRIGKHIANMRFSDYGLALSKFIALVPFATLFLMPIFNRLGWANVNEAPGFYVALLGVLMAGRNFISKIHPIEVILFFLVAFAIYVSPSIYPLSEPFVREHYASFVWMTIPFYFIGKCLNYEQDKLLIVVFTRVGFFLFLFYELFLFQGFFAVSDPDVDVDFSDEQMTVAYQFLFCVMYELIYGIFEQSKLDCYLSYIGILVILFMGARGPVVSLLLFIVGFFLFFFNYKSYKTLKRVLLLVLGGVVYVFMTPLLLGFSYLSSSIGLSTRVFDSIISKELLESNGRDEIFDELMKAISNDTNGWGYGLGSDRLFTSHVYSHNFEIEILVSFGVILGGFLLFLLAMFFFRVIFKTKGTDTCVFWYALFCFGFLPLQFSRTWINSPEFFLLIGYCVSVLSSPKHRLAALNT